MKLIICLSLVGLCLAATPSTKSKEAEKVTEKPKSDFVSPWFSSVSTDDGTKVSSPWFTSTTTGGQKQVITPFFSTAADGSKQINSPFFSAKITEPLDPSLPSTFEFLTPFGAPVDPTVKQPTVFEQIQAQANLQQTSDLQDLVTLIGFENAQLIANGAVGEYAKIPQDQYQKLEDLIQQVGQVKVQELLSSFAGEKFKFTSPNGGKKSVKLPTLVVLDKILEQLKQNAIPVPETTTVSAPFQQTQQPFVNQYFPAQQVVPQYYPYGQQWSLYEQQPQFPSQYAAQNLYQYNPYPYNQLSQQTQYPSAGSSTGFQYGQVQPSMDKSNYLPLTQKYEPVQYVPYPYQQYNQEFLPRSIYGY